MKIQSPLATTQLLVSGNAIISGNLEVTDDILPGVPDQIDIGSPSHRFRDLYLSGSTIYLGNVTLTESEEGTLKVVDATQKEIVVGEVDTGSIDLRLDALERESGSVRTDFGNYTNSADLRLSSLEVESGSVRTELNNYTSSIDTKISLLEEESGSIRFALNNFTGSSGVISGSSQFDNLNDPFTGSFTGSFTGDGAGLTGIAASLAISGSTGNDTIDLKTSALTFAGDNGVTTTVTDDTLTISIPQGTVSASSQIDHNTTTNYTANEHIDHSTVNITAGEGISGGGDITTSRTLTLNTGSAHFTEGVKAKLNSDLIVSGSDVQVKTFLSLNNVDNTSDIDKPLSTAQKLYVDEVAQGLKTRSSARVLVDTNLNATYDNGVEGSGSFLESNTNGAFPTTDGINTEELNIINTRILVIGQTNKAHNGLYVVQTPGDSETPWKIRRCRECDSSQEIPGSYVFVKSGTVYGNTGWVMLVDNPATFTIGTDNINPQQFSGAGSFLAGNGLGLDGNTFSLDTGSVHFNTGVKTKLNTDGVISGSSQISINSTSGTLNVDKGGTGQTSYTNGQLLIGSNGSLSKGTLGGTTDRIIVTSGAGTIAINADATSANTANKIVARDASGNFSAGTITATLSGNATTATTATTANATAQAVTFNNGGAGAASGTTFNGGTARTISYNTIGAPSTTGTNASGTWGISITGNAATATTLQTARAINGTNFNGSAAITTANWGTARNINGTSIDGSTNYTIGRIYDTNYRRFTNPGGGEYVTTASSVTGAIEVVFPNTFSNGMYKLVIEVYEYTTNQSFTVYAAGHTSGTLWYNTTAYIIGNPGLDRRFNVRFGRNAANRAVVYIGETNSTWSYPQVFLTEFQCGFAGFQDNSAGWAINFRTAALENVSQTVSNCQIGYAVSTNTANSVVQRDASGNFSAGTITAALSGNATTATTATTANATAQSVTFNNGGAGATSGTTFNGGTARTISYNTIGAPSTTGTNASGTWGINITGNAASISNFTVTTTASVGTDNATSTIGYISGISLFGQTDGALYSHVYSSNWKHNIFGDYRTGQLAVRGKNNGTWTGWRAILDSSNYTSYAPSLTGSGASGTWGINITGNAVNLSTNRTTWSTNGTISAVVGQLAWKNYGNNHTIFDASNSTSPDGTSVNNTNAQVAWTGTYPTLMGWNGANTYGVRVDSARISDNTSGNAATVTNGVYTSGNQTIGGTKTFSATPVFPGRIDGGGATSHVHGSISVGGTKNGYSGIAFPSANAVFMVRDSDALSGVYVNNNTWRWYFDGSGILQAGTVPHARTTGIPSSTGSGASGTWGINITGNAASATSAGSANSVPWSGIAAGTRTNYTLSFQPTSSADPYAGFQFLGTNGANAGFLLIRGTGDSFPPYTANGITLVSDQGGINFFARTGTQLIRMGTGGAETFRLTGDHALAINSSRAPIFYDSNNTAYYVDPNATTAIRTVGSWRADSAGWDGEFAGKLQYHSNNWYFQFNSNIFFRNSGGTNVLTCDSSGNLTVNGTITEVSDIRYKTNISTIKNGLGLVNKLRGVTFNWKDTGNYSYGLIAQEVEEIIPELVLETETGTLEGEASNKIKSVDYSKITAILIEAIKEQQQQLDTYKNELEELRTILTTRGE